MVSYSISSILQHPRVCIWRQQTDPEDGSPAQPPSCGLTQACSVCTGLSDLPGLSYNKKYGEKGFNNPICFRIVAILKFLTLSHKKKQSSMWMLIKFFLPHHLTLLIIITYY